MTDPAEARAMFGQLLDIAASRLSSTPPTAAGWLQVAAQYAWFVNPGGMTSPRLESILRRLAAEVPTAESPSRGSANTVLHVATSLHEIGGHSRLLQNWIAADDSGRHAVVVTDQRAALPQLIDSGARDVRVDCLTGSLIDRASKLRALARDCERILLHTDPHDVVPFLALTPDATATKVLLVNHADHVFAVGTNSADAVLNLREAGRQLCVEYRNVAQERALLLPIPLSQPAADLPPLPLPNDRECFTVVTIAEPYKFGDPEEFFLPAVEDFLSRCEEGTAVVVGPVPRGPWAVTARRFSGRLLVLGRVPGAARMLANADAYLDSAPAGSLTSVLEVGLTGTPIVTWRRDTAHPVFTSDDPALTDVAAWSETPSDASAALIRWYADPSVRSAVADATAAAIQSVHVGRNWSARLQATLATTHDLAPRVPPQLSDELIVPIDESLLWPLRAIHQPPAFAHDLLWFLRRHGQFIGRSRSELAAIKVAAAVRKAGLSSRERAGSGQRALTARLGR